MNRNSAALIVIVAASLILIGVLTLAAPKKEPERKGQADVTVVIDFGNQAPGESGPGSAPPWNMSVKLQNGTVYGALGAAASSANFTFKADWYPNFQSHRVTEIAGVADGTDGRYWQYYVNGQYLDKGADLVALSDGDTVRWEFRSALQ